MIIFQSLISDFKANGIITMKATVHLQKAILTGGMLVDKSLAMIKLPDHKAVASKANAKPKSLFLSCKGLIKI